MRAWHTEYTLPKAIKEGYLCPIKAQTIPLKLGSVFGVTIQAGDFKAGDISNSPRSVSAPNRGRDGEIVCQGPEDGRVPAAGNASARSFARCSIGQGFAAAEVNGESMDRAQKCCRILMMENITSCVTACCLQKAGTVRLLTVWWCSGRQRCGAFIARW